MEVNKSKEIGDSTSKMKKLLLIVLLIVRCEDDGNLSSKSSEIDGNYIE